MSAADDIAGRAGPRVRSARPFDRTLRVLRRAGELGRTPGDPAGRWRFLQRIGRTSVWRGRVPEITDHCWLPAGRKRQEPVDHELDLTRSGERLVEAQPQPRARAIGNSRRLFDLPDPRQPLLSGGSPSWRPRARSVALFRQGPSGDTEEELLKSTPWSGRRGSW